MYSLINNLLAYVLWSIHHGGVNSAHVQLFPDPHANDDIYCTLYADIRMWVSKNNWEGLTVDITTA